MKAVLLPRYGGPEVLEYVTDHPKPVLGPDEVLVHIHAVALNHLDLFVREGIPTLKLTLPHILGADVAGEVDRHRRLRRGRIRRQLRAIIDMEIPPAFLAGIAQAEPQTRTSTFDGPNASGSKTSVRDKEAGTFSSDKIVTRKSDGATATTERDRQRTDSGVTGSGSRNGFNGKTATYDYERTKTDNGWTATGSGTGPNGGEYNYTGSKTRAENGFTANRSASRNGNEIYNRTDTVSRSNGNVTRDTSVTRKQRKR